MHPPINMNLKDFAARTAVFNDMRQLIVCMEKLVVISDPWNPGNAFWREGHSAIGDNHQGLLISLSIPRCRRLISFAVSLQGGGTGGAMEQWFSRDLVRNVVVLIING